MDTSKSRVERYLDHLDSIFLVEPELFPLESPRNGGPPVSCIVYRDIPKPGMITGITYGVSTVSHPQWIRGRPELSISVKSSDTVWPCALSYMAAHMRGECPFRYGDVINFREVISPEESEMSGFLIFAPAILDREVAFNIDLGDDLPVHIAGAYPIYDSERDVIQEIGLEQFWHHPSFDMYDISRNPVSIPSNRP